MIVSASAGSEPVGISVANDESGYMNMVLNGANPRISLGAESPVGSTRLNLCRGGTGNNTNLAFGSGGDGTHDGRIFSGGSSGDNQRLTMGLINSPAALNLNCLIGHRNLYDRYTVFGGTQGEYIFNIHSTNNNVEINGHTTNPAYALSVNGDIYATGNITAYSDRRRKKEIKTLENGLDRVLQLRGVNYRWRKYEEVAPEDRHLLPHDDKSSHGEHDQTDYESVQMGLIAQEAQDIIPEVILENPENGCLSIDYAHMAGLLVEAIKDLNKKVDSQQEEIERLQNEQRR